MSSNCSACGNAIPVEVKFCGTCGVPANNGSVPVSSAKSAMDTAKIVYYLYLAGILTVGITTIVGLIFAYVNRGEADGMARSHFDFQIGTFWKGFLVNLGFGALIGILGSITIALAFSGGFGSVIAWLVGGLIGGVYIAMLGVGILIIARIVKGLMIAQGNRTINNPSVWLLPKG
jgi:uncharacterized membrane protein